MARTSPVRRSHPPFRRKFLVEALEPRILLSADLPVVPPPPPDPLPPPSSVDAAAAAGGEAPPQFDFDATALAEDFAVAFAPSPPAESDAPTEIAFVDSRVVGQDALTVERDGLLVVVLDANQDGIAQISETLAQHQGLQAVHLLAHGGSGQMFLGSTVLDTDAIAQGKVATWGQALGANGDLLLYGCSVAEGELGVSFAQNLSAATGADVGASSDATGDAAQGGDWELEFTIGTLEISALSVSELAGLLTTFTGTAGNDNFTGGTGGNDIYNFQSAQLTSADRINDSGGTDELRITDAANLADAAFTDVSGVEELVLGNFVNSVTLGTEAEQWAASVGGTLLVDASATTGTNGTTLSASAFTAAASIDYTAGAGNDAVTGGAGDDIMRFVGSSWGTTNTFTGGGGTDTLDFSGVSSALIFELGAAGAVTVKSGSTTIATASGIERIVGGSSNNTFKLLAGGSFGGSIEGNGALNALDYSAYGAGATINLADADTVAGSVTGISGTVTDITNVTGSAFADTITDGGIGDTYLGGGGNDTYVFADDWGTDDITDASGSNILSFSGASTGISVEFTNVTYDIVVTEGLNRLNVVGTFGEVEGSSDDDVFTAKLGVTVDADVLGGDGNDAFKVETGSDYTGTVDGQAGTEDAIDYTSLGGNVDSDASPRPNFSGTLLNVEKIQHPLTVPDGILTVAGLIQDGIDATIGNVEIPLLGNVGSEVSSFIDDLATTLSDGLTAELLVNIGDPRSTGEIIEDWLVDVLSVDFTTQIPGATVGTFGLTAIDGNHMEFAVVLEGVIFEDVWAIDFGAAIPGLGLDVDAELELSITYALRLAFGVDYSTLSSPKFYFDTNGADDVDPDDDDEITLSLEATIASGDISDPQLTAVLGFLQFDATSYDNSTQTSLEGGGASPYRDSLESGLFGSFAIDLQDPGGDPTNALWATDDGRLTSTEFMNSNFSLAENLVAKFGAFVDVDLFARLSADVVSAGLPSVQFYLHYDQTFVDAEVKFNGDAGDQATFGGPPTIVIEDLALDLGTFLSEFINPILEQVQVVTGPLQPIVELLQADIPILSDIDLLKNLLNKDGENGVDIIDFMGTVLGGTKYASVVTAVNAIVELIDLVNSIPTEGNILIPFGTFTFGGPTNDLRDSSSQMALPSSTPDETAMRSKINSSSASTDTKNFLEKLKRDTVGGGFSIPILTEPVEMIKLITGRTANLFFYDLPELNFDFNFRKSTPIVFPLNMIIDAGFDVTVRMGFGYDSSGIQEFVAGGFTDPVLIFKGFFIDDHGVEGTSGDLDEVEVHSHFSVGASVGVSGIVEAGVEGGVMGDIGFDLNDVDSNGPAVGGYDGKVYFHELDNLLNAGPECFIDIHGGLDWFLRAFVWVGLDLGFFGKITLFDETFDLGGGTIVEFEHHCDVSAFPDVADKVGADLVLHMGTDADQRDDDDSAYSDIDGTQSETFGVQFVAAGGSLADFVFSGSSPPTTAAVDSYVVTYNGASEIFARSGITRILVSDAQGGNDVLTVGEGVTANLQFSGGDGNDKVTYLGTGTATINGQGGDDRLVVANGVGVLDGGAGDDTLTGGALGDTIRGGDGNDKIKGGAGNDWIEGGMESVVVNASGKANGDTIDGGDGDDVIYGGTASGGVNFGSPPAPTAGDTSGSDIIKGGKGADRIWGGDEDGTIALASGKLLGDSIDGGDDNDTVFAGRGADVIKGGKGDDILWGGAHNDSFTGGIGLDQIRGEADNDSINWTAGDQVDSVIDGGTGNDTITVTGSAANTNIVMSRVPSTSNVLLAWGADNLTLIGVEKFALNAGTGLDNFTINDLAGSTAREVAMSLGAALTDVTRYDWDGDGTIEAVEGAAPRYLLDAEGLQIDSDPLTAGVQPAFDDYGVLSDVVRQTVYDGFADTVTIYSGTGADQFTGETRTDVSNAGSTVLNLSRTGTATVAYSIAQGDQARDTFLLSTDAGNDGIDLSAVVTKVFSSVTLDSGADNDIVFGTQFADTINSGAGNDKVSGNAGIDTFIDASGTDTLSEVNHGAPNNVYDPVTGALTSSSTSFSYFNLADADFTLDGNTLTIAHAASEAENISMFEEVSLVAASNSLTYVAGADTNTFTVQNWQKVARLDGGQGSDTYNITFAGSGSGRVTENDSIHVAGNVDRMFLFGTAGVDIFSFTANNDDWQVDDDGDGVVDAGDPTVNADLILTDGAVSLLHGPQVETVNYTHSERLEVRAGDGNDALTIDDNALQLHVYGEAGNDSFLIGRVTSSHEDPPGSGIVIADSITNGVSSESFFYGDFGEVLQSTGPNANDPRNPFIDPLTGKTIEINVAQSGNDSFEVNHNKAPVWLFGNAGDDRFTVNAILIDTGGTPENPNNVSGGTGTNTITYLQNAPVNIDGGSGNDIVVVNGTGIGDTFIVAVVTEDHDSNPATPDIQRQKVIGAGLQINMKNVERLEVNGAGGDDRIHVFSTLPEIEVIISGGSGDDTIHVGGQAVAIVVDPPDFINDPPAYTFDAPPYVDHWESVSWSWGDYWYFNWYFPFWHYQPLVTYTWWYPVWIDPAPVTIDPPPQTIDPPAFQFASGPRTELTGIQGKLRIEAGDLDNTGGLNDNDRIVVHNQSGNVADTGLLTTGDHDDDVLSADVGYLEGLGMARPVYDTDGITIIGSMVGGVYYLGAENLDIHLNDDAAASDDFTIAYTDPDTTTTVFLGQGDDRVRVKAASGVVQLDGGAGDDTFEVWSDSNLLDGIAGTLRINGGTDSDSVDIRDTADTLDDTATLTASALTGLDMAGSIQYGPFTTQTFTYLYQFQTVVDPGPPADISSVLNPQTFTLAYGPIETLVIGTGSGNDVIDVQGTQAATTINTNDGDDTINVSSDGALLGGTLDDVNGALTLHLGAGDNTLNVSDFGDADADGAVTITSSTISGLAPALITYDTTNRFTGGVNIWAGRGNDTISILSTLLADVTTLYANDGDDSVTVANLTGGSNRLLAVHGDAGDDTLDASAITGSNVTVVLFGDSGQESYLGTDKTLLNLTGVTSSAIGAPGNDTLLAGAGPAILIGGANNAGSAVNSGRDRLTGAGFDDVLIGDDGTATFNAGIVTSFGSLGTAGGDDQIDAGGGRNYVIGGVGADIVTAGTGNDVVLGDNGGVTYTTGGVIVSVVSSDLASGGSDTITAGEGNNVVVGGAAGDTIGTPGVGAGDDVLVGDNATVTWDPATGFVTQFANLGTDGGDDTIIAGDGRNLVLGGVGSDSVTAGTGNDVVLGDDGIVNFTSLGVITDATSTDLGVGAGENLDAGAGDNVVLGGAGDDIITVLGGNDVLAGDNATAIWNPATGFVTQFRTTDTTAATGGDDTIGAGDGRNLVLGGVGSDSVTAGAGDDVVLGDNGVVNFTSLGKITDATSTDLTTGGVDIIDAGDGDNMVLGGAGGDTITALGGNDVLVGDNATVTWDTLMDEVVQFASLGTDGGNDTIAAGEGDNLMLGGLGADGITAGAGDDTVLGDNGRALFTSAGEITLFETTDLASGGNDTVSVGGGDNTVAGGFGADMVTTDANDDLILGDNGRFSFAGLELVEAVTTDTSTATGGDDILLAGDGHNIVLGGVGNDTITTGAGDDVVIGDNGIAQFDAAGNLTLAEARDPLLAGSDTINAGGGNDVVLGGAGSDSIDGGAGNDVLLGDGGTATFSGGSLTMVVGDSDIGGDDTIIGGGGNDILLGGAGTDTLSANLFDDIFTGANARITFSGGLVTLIEIFGGGPDLVLQQLFGLFLGDGEEGGFVLANEEQGEPGVGEFTITTVEGGDGSTGPGTTLPTPAVIFSFQHGQPLATLPETLRNIVLQLYLGNGTPPPTHGGESGGTEQSEGQAGADSLPVPTAEAEAPVAVADTQDDFTVEAAASTVEADSTAATTAAAALAGMSASAAGRTVRAYDPATGRFAERPAGATLLDRAAFERGAFAPAGIDW